MKEGPNIAHIAALIGDPARANMLTALIDGRALSASELAAHAGVTKQTASTHLAKLCDGKLVARTVQGRHHYFRLNGEDVAAVLEAIMGVAIKHMGARTRTGPKDAALRKARRCYDHLAGEMAVFMYEKMISKGWLKQVGDTLVLSNRGVHAFESFGIDMKPIQHARRPVVKPCLDWSMRKPHLAGGLGKAILTHMTERAWVRCDTQSRVVKFSSQGEAAFRQWLA